MRKLIPTLTLATTLVLTTVCAAGPRVRQAPPLLTPEEMLCHAFGELTYDLAIGRDSGIPILNAISIMREAMPENVRTPMLEYMLKDAIQLIYKYPGVQPDFVRQTNTLACLENRPFAGAQTPTKTKDRY